MSESPVPAEELSRRVICLGTSPTLQRTMVFRSVVGGETNRAETIHEYASGKAVNSARVLHLLGRETLYLGQIGGDRGESFRRDLETAGIPHDLLDVPQPTRLCVTVVDRSRRSATELIEEAHDVAPDVAGELLDRLAIHLAAGAGIVIMSGSLAPGVGEDFYATAVQIAHDAGAQVVMDARGEPLRAALQYRPEVVKPNRAELAATVGRAVESRNAMHEAMAAVYEKGARWVVCTRGRDGASICGHADGKLRFWEVTTPRIEMQNPVGSGDAFAAGLSVGMSEGVTLPDACRYAAACGAANAETLDAGHVDPMHVASLMDEIVIREVA